MQIRKLTITRFRGIEYLELFPGTATVLLGPNNAGKSTVLEAIDLLLHPGFGRPRPGPRETDYFKRNPAPEFFIEAIIGDLSESFTAQVRDHIEGWRGRDRLVVPQPDGPEIEPCIQVRVRGTSDFELVHEFVKTETSGTRFSAACRADIGWFFDARIRDPAWHFSFYQRGLLDRLFTPLSLGPCVEELKQALSAGARAVNDDTAVAGVLTNLAADLLRLGLLPEGERPGFEIGGVSQREMLQTLRLYLPCDGIPIPLAQQGRGAQRLLLLATLLRLSELSGKSPIGGFEEPEEALEPLRQMQVAKLLSGLTRKGGQIFVVTHAPEIARAFELEDFVLVQPNTKPCALRNNLSSRVKQAYERRVDGPVVRGLFAHVSLLVEGPSDRALLEVFWEALTKNGTVAERSTCGLDFINCEGAPMMPMMAELLSACQKPCAALLEMDTEQVRTMASALIVSGHCKAWIPYNDPMASNLEQMLAMDCSLASLNGGLTAIATDRGYSWESQQLDLLSRWKGSCETLEAMKQSTCLTALLAIPAEQDTRHLIASALSSNNAAPFDLKGARQARLLGSAIVASEGVPKRFATALRRLSEWITAGCAAGTAIPLTPDHV